MDIFNVLHLRHMICDLNAGDSWCVSSSHSMPFVFCYRFNKSEVFLQSWSGGKWTGTLYLGLFDAHTEN